MYSLNILFVVKLLCVVSVYSLQSNLLPSSDVCGKSDVGSNTDDVVETALNEFPWLALLEYKNENDREGSFKCGGVLINDRYVMTAAHCALYTELVSVRLGEYKQSTHPDCVKNGDTETCAPEPIDVPVAETIIHEDFNKYNRNKTNNIALIRLERPVTFNEYVKPICLATSDSLKNKNYTGSNLILSGWGSKVDGERIDVKTKLSVPVYSNEDCAKIYTPLGATIGDGQICAGGVKDKSLCQGSSGTALMAKEENDGKLRWYAVGIVSFGPRCGAKNIPDAYTRLSEYIPWITSKLQA